VAARAILRIANRISPKVTPINVPFGRAPPILSFVPNAAADAALRVMTGREPGEMERRETT
jgi:hypothetical protein